MNPISVSCEKLNRECKVEHTCPITLMPFNRPWILLEDGFTYEKDAIEQWLEKNPFRSPMVGKLSSATLLPNCTVKKMDSTCPITLEPFQEPYYCVEDGHTYEKKAIIEWFESKIKESLEQEIYSPVTSPVTLTEFNSLTLYPNKILFNNNIPRKQEFLTIKIDINEIISHHYKDNIHEIKCIFDAEVRELIECYANEKDSKKKELCKNKINERRLGLGLKVTENMYDTLDLSHLNLSKMNLQGLQQKGSLFKETDFSHSVLSRCLFSGCRFLNCNMQGTCFLNCDFRGEQVSFYNTDMKDAVIEDCYLEKGNTWNCIRSRDDFKSELSKRGARNVDSVCLKLL